jgi:E3 ubiquitin-protein ligase BRE1
MSRKCYCGNVLAEKAVLNCLSDGVSSTFKDAFLSRLIETGATENSSTYSCTNHMKEDKETAFEKTRDILCNIVSAVDNVWYLKDGLPAAVLKELPEDGKD